MTVISFSALLAVAILWTGQISAKSIHGITDIGKKNHDVVLDYQSPTLEHLLSVSKDQLPEKEIHLPLIEDHPSEIDNEFINLEYNLPVLQNQLTVLENILPVLENKMPALPAELAVLVDDLSVLEDHLIVLENRLPNMQDSYNLDKSTQTELKKQKPVKSSEIFDIAITECTYPFEKVGRNCYMFSETKLSYDNAKAYCESISHGHTHEISLGMLGYSVDEDQDILNAVSSKNNTFWVGGFSEDNTSYKWVDNREIDLRAQFWTWRDPHDEKCIAAQSKYYHDNITRSSLHTHTCDDHLKFICQIGCPESFVRIGNHCYMRSEDFGIPELSWSDARQYCSSLAMPEGYYADLAVFGLQDQNVYNLMKTLLASDDDDSTAWIGASKDDGCKYMWIDGRELDAESMYWDDYFDDYPICDDDYKTVLYDAGMDFPDYRPLIFNEDGKNTESFICQIFKGI